MNILPHSPLRTWLLGRFSLSLPEYMLPDMPIFRFQWDDRTPDNDYALAYPISLNEQPYADAATARAEWRKAVDELLKRKKKSFWGLAFHWDVSKLFDVPAYLICYKKNALFNFHILLQRPECLMHLIGRHGYYYPDTAKKGRSPTTSCASSPHFTGATVRGTPHVPATSSTPVTASSTVSSSTGMSA